MATTKSKAQHKPSPEETEAAAAYLKTWHPVAYSLVVWALLWVVTGFLRVVSIIFGMPTPLPRVNLLPAMWIAIAFGVGSTLAWKAYTNDKTRREEKAIATRRRVMLAENGLPDPGDDVLAEQAEKEGKRVAATMLSFETVCRTSSLQALKPGEEEKSIPKLGDVRCTVDLDVTAKLHTVGGNGITIRDIRSNADRFAEVAGAHKLRVRTTGKPGDAVLTWVFTNPLERTIRVQDLPQPRRAGNAVIGITENGDPMELDSDKPGAWAGWQGSGKSNALKAKLASLLGQGLYVELHIINPKKMEWRRYAVAAGYEVDDVADTITRPTQPEWRNQLKVANYAEGDHAEGLEVVEAYYARVMRQAGHLASKGILNAATQTKVGDSPDNPYIWFINDEGGDYLKEEQAGSLHVYGLAKQKARATGGGLDACFLQVNESTLKEGRKLYGNRIGFRSEEGTGIALFGRSAVEKGARLNEIPKGTPGVGVYQDPDTGDLAWFRGAIITDTDEARMADEGLPPEGMGAGRDLAEDPIEDWYVYVLPDVAGDTPYVGMTGQDDPWDRVQQHREDKPWFPEVDETAIRIYRRDSEEQARRLEYLLIRKLRPFYNTQHNMDNPRRIDWKTGYVPRDVGLTPELLAEETATRKLPRVTVPKVKARKPRPQPAEPVPVVDADTTLLTNLQASRYTKYSRKAAA